MAFGAGARGTQSFWRTREGELCPQAANTREETALLGTSQTLVCRQSPDPHLKPGWAGDPGAPGAGPWVQGSWTQVTTQQSCEWGVWVGTQVCRRWALPPHAGVPSSV